MFTRRSWNQPLGPAIVTMYLIALAWMWFGVQTEDWFNHVAKAILLVVPLLVFGYQTLYESGARISSTSISAPNIVGKGASKARSRPTAS
jgi:ABC-type Co2+ transport system permease subunit